MITVSNYNAGAAATTSSGSSGGISSLQEGPGINIQNPNGPTATIANTGVISLLSGNDITTANNLDGSWTVSSTPYSPWELPNNINSNTIVLNSNTTSLQYNPLCGSGNQAIVATGTLNTEVLTLTTNSSTNAGLKIGSDSVAIGAGGTSNLSTNSIGLDSTGQVSIKSTDEFNVQATNNIIMATQSTILNSSDSFEINSDIIEINAQTIGIVQITGSNISFSDVPVTIGTQPALTDSSTKMPSTSWVQGVVSNAVIQPNKTYTVDITSGTTTTLTIPANVEKVDVVLFSGGGLCGASAAATGGGTYYGGAGGGGTLATLSNMTVREGQQFKYSYDSTSVTLQFTLNSLTVFDIMADLANGGNGTPATATSGGQGGGPATTANVDAQYGTWQIRYGSSGANAPTLNSIPNFGGRPGGRPFIAGDRGCGQQSSATSYGRPILYLTYYFNE